MKHLTFLGTFFLLSLFCIILTECQNATDEDSEHYKCQPTVDVYNNTSQDIKVFFYYLDESAVEIGIIEPDDHIAKRLSFPYDEERGQSPFALNYKVYIKMAGLFDDLYTSGQRSFANCNSQSSLEIE